MSQRRTKDEHRRLVEVFLALCKDRLTAKDREWLIALLSRLLDAEDVRDRFFEKPRPGERPYDEFAEWRAEICARYIAYQSLRARADHITVADAKFEAETHFGMTEAQVHRAWLKYSRQARKFAEVVHENVASQPAFRAWMEYAGEACRLADPVHEMPDLVHSSKRK